MFAQIKAAVDLVQHVSKFVELRGARPAKGLCPFHQEKTPSFCVYDDGHWHCYGGCSTGGSIIDFEAMRLKSSILDAARSLCQDYGIVISQEEQERFVQTQVLREQKGAIAKALEESRDKRPDVLEYLRKERGFSDATIADFGIGVGLKDNVFVVPIKDKFGKVIAFAKRYLDYKERSLPKWWNDPADPIYEKKKILFNLDRAKRALSSDARLILAESYCDVIALHEAGLNTGVAYCSANVTVEQCAEIKSLASAGMTILFAACSDKTAQDKLLINRTMIRSVSPETHIRAIVVPDGCKDLNDILVRDGAEGLRKAVASSIPMDQYLLDRALDSEPVVDLQYRKAKQIVSVAENAMSAKDMIVQLAKRWNKDEATVNQYMTGGAGDAAGSLQFDNISSLIAKYEKHVREIDQNVIKFGWDRYNKLTRGMHRGDVIQLVAPSGVGKTTWAESLILSIGETQPSVPMIFFSMEQTGIMAFERFMQMEGSLRGAEVEKWMIAGNDSHNSKIFGTAQRLLSKLKNFLVCDQGGLTMAQIESHTRQAGFAYFGKPVGIIFIDYLGYLKGDGGSTYEIVSAIAREQKEIAKKLNCVVVSLHQTTKAVSAGDEIDESHARDSSAIRDSADVLITAWRPEMKKGMLDGEKNEWLGVWRSKIVKNRYGPSNEIVDLMFVPEFMRLTQRDTPALEQAIKTPLRPTLPNAPGFSGGNA